ncbi:hypothetical protein TARUN_8344 [Trichoderma arundinaceum]|uniref:Uncharacterized protein n=1 Tax=Trichoderma arundinaceum TaxID=490622 RepID=A0A395NCS4_TRIAR|nr:hypothetical protein TARUN_8344 [Trichoderma arundinaceum]
MRLLLMLTLSGLAIASAARDRYAALQIVPDGLTPRYFVDKSHPLFKRAGSCGDNAHSCLDIGHGDRCCDNNSYCYINTSNDPKCCAIGQACTSDNPCPATAVRCTVTRTLTITSTTARASATRTTSTTVITGCCGRACPQTSFYLCPSTLGGNCCPFDSNCQAGGHCVSTKTQPPPGLTPAAEGCTTNQFRCADGNGCCNNGQACTSFSGSPYCSTATGGPTSTLAVDDSGSSSSSSGGLSPGAEAGIAVGAVVGGGLIVAAAVWFYLTKRRAAAEARVYNNASQQSGDPNGGSVAPGDPAMGNAPTSPQGWPPRWTMVSSVTPSGAVTDAGTIRSPSSAPDHPVEIGSEERSEVQGSEVMSPKSGVSSLAVAGLRTPETIDGRFELHGTEGNWPLPSPPLPSPTSPMPSSPPPDPSRISHSSQP